MFKTILVAGAIALSTVSAMADVYSLTCDKSDQSNIHITKGDNLRYQIEVDPKNKVLVINIDGSLVIPHVTDVIIEATKIKVYAETYKGNTMVVQIPNFANYQEIKQYVSSYNIRTGVQVTDVCQTTGE